MVRRRGSQGTGQKSSTAHIPFQLPLIFSVDMYHSPMYCYRDWETSKGVGPTSEEAGTVTMVIFFPHNPFWESNGNYDYKAKLTHLL